jgi:hypothetical protein
VDTLQTIIECLKYATTGALPPGAQQGKTFVHDPRVFALPLHFDFHLNRSLCENDTFCCAPADHYSPPMKLYPLFVKYSDALCAYASDVEKV